METNLPNLTIFNRLMMSSKKYFLSLGLVFCLFYAGASVSRAVDKTNIAWGGVDPISDSFLLADSTGTLFDNNALFMVGYFSAGFDVTANATNLTELFNNFTALDSGQVGAEESPAYNGYIEGDVTIDTDVAPGSNAVNQVVYYWVLPGITSFDLDSVLSVTEQAILSDSSWQFGGNPGAIPAGTASTNLYNIATNNLDTIVYGEVNGVGRGEGSITIRTVAVPEPAFYAAGLGLVALLVVQLRRRRQAA
ncbi:hypothetical protein H5P28_00490 [Ruficoccus amylovorans]|uniref:Uncharacterized protein n=1 Tax=Ruficoccus amylovorans TaxID=1804625 RepID=A0A842H9E8_9BACT|nr:hypothetical protein [Ruficoccus amylovorans]MBC2592728.1 hypothetical protein [Ruficoccus amylovorans]